MKSIMLAQPFMCQMPRVPWVSHRIYSALSIRRLMSQV
ncbi:hypothetical protein BMETH_1072_1 [methanotrophic bacterial endosymbiont of Bathymodiolus sp.]|nr:hypothetical protein BMETH_1072_1 [methanotrophic bacterial endosymbiont of Bathymodiolus sp.]